ncbi:hypothetical protein N0V85_009985, partial [Neurospora sp. IMI 360204]
AWNISPLLSGLVPWITSRIPPSPPTWSTSMRSPYVSRQKTSFPSHDCVKPSATCSTTTPTLPAASPSTLPMASGVSPSWAWAPP